jgi:hypothetical protein
MSEVQSRETELAELRQNLAQRQEALLVLAQQALAYARVYAENDEPLLEELNRISLPRATKPRKASAGKTTGARDVARSEAGTDAEGEPGSEAERNGTAELNDKAERDKAERDEAELDGAASATEAPRRGGRKARGSVPQRASN